MVESRDETAIDDAIGFSGADAALRERLLRPSYQRYILVVMFAGTALNLLDRQIISILLEPIKQDLGVSDSLMGLLTGLSFALFYAGSGIPIAALADYRSRRVIMSLSIGFWSLMTMIGGAAQNFAQLAIARMGVGIGEAGFAPAAISMTADYFPRHRRSSAVAISSSGAMVGSMLGLVIGGWAVHQIGWRGAMLIAGLPGLLLAALVWFTVKEPLRGMADGDSPPPKPRVSLIAAAAALWKIRSYRYISLGAGLSSFTLYAFSIWMPALLARSYGMTSAHIGFILGPVLGIVGVAGALASGYLCDYLSRRDVRWTIWVPAIATVVALPIAFAAFALDSKAMTIGLFAVSNALIIMFSPPTNSIVQSLTPLHLRATATAWKLLIVNLVGLGLGPVAIGFVSEALVPSYGTESLRIAMLTMTPALLLPAIFYTVGARFIHDDMQSATKA